MPSPCPGPITNAWRRSRSSFLRRSKWSGWWIERASDRSPTLEKECAEAELLERGLEVGGELELLVGRRPRCACGSKTEVRAWTMTMVVASLTLGCGSDDRAAAVSETETESESETASETETESGSAPEVPVESEMRAIVLHLREGRAATRSESWPTATEAFDALSALRPHDPAIRCEAGYVFFLAGDNARAAEHLDLGLAWFGARALLDRRAERVLAMCLFNRGLVHEALDEDLPARERFEAALRIRDSSTVRARLETLGRGSLHAVELVNAPGVRQLVQALADAGCADAEAGRHCRNIVRVLARRAPSAAAAEAALLLIEPREGGLVDVDVALFVGRRSGWERLDLTRYAYDNTSHVGGGGYWVETTADGLEIMTVGGSALLQARLTYRETTTTSEVDLGVEDGEPCYRGWSGVAATEERLLCRLRPTLDCRRVAVELEVEAYTEHTRCPDDPDDDIDPEEDLDSDPTSWRRELVVDSDGSVHLHTREGHPDVAPPDGDSTLEQLFDGFGARRSL